MTTHGRDDSTELRLDAPNNVVSVLDGVSLAQGLTRNQLVLRVLTSYANERLHEANVLSRVAGINPQRAEDAGRRG